MSDEKKLIVSPDTQRAERVPPGQVRAKQWPVLHAGAVPLVDLKTWDFRAWGLVENEARWNWEQFSTLPRVQVKADMHCVTTWSLLDNVWEGVSVHEVMKHVRLKPEAKFVLVHAEHGFTTNLPLEEFLKDDVVFAFKNNGEELSAKHGSPMRLVVPQLYAWKSAKWARGVEFLAEDRPGFWERGGYHNRGNPWSEERFGR